jgi:hypothetical protein
MELRAGFLIKPQHGGPVLSLLVCPASAVSVSEPSQPGYSSALGSLEIDPGELGDAGDPIAQRVAVDVQSSGDAALREVVFD